MILKVDDTSNPKLKKYYYGFNRPLVEKENNQHGCSYYMIKHVRPRKVRLGRLTSATITTEKQTTSVIIKLPSAEMKNMHHLLSPESSILIYLLTVNVTTF